MKEFKELTHPILGDQTFGKDHAERILAYAKKNPNGWKSKDEAGAKTKDLENKEDEVIPGTGEVKIESKQGKVVTGSKSRGKDKVARREEQPTESKD